MAKTNIKELEEELKWLEETPFYIGRDGMPSMLLILFVLFTGILPGILIVLGYKAYRKYSIKKKISQLK